MAIALYMSGAKLSGTCKQDWANWWWIEFWLLTASLVFQMGVVYHSSFAMSNEHSLKGAVYLEQGRIDEVVAESQMAAQDPVFAEHNASMLCDSCCLCCLGIFKMYWWINGGVMALK